MLTKFAAEALKHRCVLRRDKKLKNVINLYKLTNNKHVLIKLIEIDNGQLEIDDGSIKYMKTDKQSQLAPKTVQYVPTSSVNVLKTMFGIMSKIGIEKHIPNFRCYDLNPIYKGGKTDLERRRVLAEVY